MDTFLEDEIKNIVIKSCLERERDVLPKKYEMFSFAGVQEETNNLQFSVYCL